MADTTVTKVYSKHSPKGEMGQKCLASGVPLIVRLWASEGPGEPKPGRRREYETVGCVVGGVAEPHLGSRRRS
jgi:hypothetical protein